MTRQRCAHARISLRRSCLCASIPDHGMAELGDYHRTSFAYVSEHQISPTAVRVYAVRLHRGVACDALTQVFLQRNVS